VKIGEYSAQIKGKIHFRQHLALAPVLLPISIISRFKFCFNTLCDGVLRFADKPAGRGFMRFSGKTLVKSSHDLVLIIGAVIAIAMIVSKMVHNWRTSPPSLGMSSGVVMMADSNPAPRCGNFFGLRMRGGEPRCGQA
jgi:hypothetical protein